MNTLEIIFLVIVGFVTLLFITGVISDALRDPSKYSGDGGFDPHIGGKD